MVVLEAAVVLGAAVALEAPVVLMLIADVGDVTLRDAVSEPFLFSTLECSVVTSDLAEPFSGLVRLIAGEVGSVGVASVGVEGIEDLVVVVDDEAFCVELGVVEVGWMLEVLDTGNTAAVFVSTAPQVSCSTARILRKYNNRIFRQLDFPFQVSIEKRRNTAFDYEFM